MPTVPTNIEMAKRFKELGFIEDPMFSQPMLLAWRPADDGSIIFMYSTQLNGGVACSAPRLPAFSFPLGLSQEKMDAFLEMGVDFTVNDDGDIAIRQALLDIASFYTDHVEHYKAEPKPDPDSIMGIMNNIKDLADEIKGGA